MGQPQPTPDSPTLIFLHVPKTAGTTFSSILALFYPRAKHSIYHIPQGVIDFQQMPIEQRATFDLIQGHFSYGIHQYVPRPARYITFLRHPIERIVSLYYYFQRSSGHYLHDVMTANKTTLADFVNEPLTSEICNFHVHAIAGIDELNSTVCPKLEMSAVDLAKQRLETDYAAFGLTENFDASLVLFSRALGWRLLSPKLFYQRRNVAPDRKLLASIDPEIIATIRQNNQLDLELYDYATKLFKARWAADWRLQRQLQLFQQARKFWLKLKGFKRG